jgi:hypothetical protein
VSVVHLRAGRVSLALATDGGAGAPLPVVLQWGPDPGEVGLPLPVLRPERALPLQVTVAGAAQTGQGRAR